MINNTFDKKIYKDKMKEKLNYAYKLIDDSVEKLKDSRDFFQNYIDVQSRFDIYTVRNALLITQQNPKATQLKSYEKWKESQAIFKKRYPEKIVILEPRKTTTKEGKVISGFTAKEVIDISEISMRQVNKNYDKKLLLQSILHNCLVEIKVVDNLEENKICEWNEDENVMYISKNEDPDLIFQNVATEIAKIEMYELNQDIDNDNATAISYMLCKRYNIECPQEYVDKLFLKCSDIGKEELLDNLTSIKDVVSNMNNRIEQYLENKESKTIVREKQNER